MNFWTTLKSPSRIILIMAITIAAHLLVLTDRMLGKRLMKAIAKPIYAKGRSITSLLTSAAIFSLFRSHRFDLKGVWGLFDRLLGKRIGIGIGHWVWLTGIGAGCRYRTDPYFLRPGSCG